MKDRIGARCVGVCIAVCLLLGAGRCAALEFEAGKPVTVRPGHGLLAIDARVPALVGVLRIERVGTLFGGVTVARLRTGENLRLVEVPAGEYR